MKRLKRAGRFIGSVWRTFQKRKHIAMIVAVFLICVVSISLSQADKGGNGGGKGGGKGGGDDPPPPPPIHLRVTFLWHPTWDADTDARSRDMNDSGVVVGKSNLGRAWMYDHVNAVVNGRVKLLDDLTNVWIDVGGLETADGWIAASAFGINNNGDIVGEAVHGSLPSRAFVLSFPVDPNLAPEFILLPRFGTGGNLGRAINDSGVVAAIANGEGIIFTPATGQWSAPGFGVGPGAMDINNSGVICAGNSLVMPDNDGNYTPGGVFPFPVKTFYGINETGMTSGGQEQIRGKNKQDGGAFRMDELLNTVIIAGNDFVPHFAGGINDAGDVCASAGAGYVYTDQDGLLNLDDLVVFDTVEDGIDWMDSGVVPWKINNRDITGFGQICGLTPGGRAWVLTPEPVQ